MCSGSDRFGHAAEPGTDARVGEAWYEDSGGASEGGGCSPLSRPQGWGERLAGRDRSDPFSEAASASPNLIIGWLRRRSGSMRSYLKYLIESDLSLRESLGELYLGSARSDHRLALALFIDFSHQQRLGPGELAPLMADARHDLLDAVCFVIGSAVKEAESDGSLCELGTVNPGPMVGAA